MNCSVCETPREEVVYLVPGRNRNFLICDSCVDECWRLGQEFLAGQNPLAAPAAEPQLEFSLEQGGAGAQTPEQFPTHIENSPRSSERGPFQQGTWSFALLCRDAAQDMRSTAARDGQLTIALFEYQRDALSDLLMREFQAIEASTIQIFEEVLP